MTTMFMRRCKVIATAAAACGILVSVWMLFHSMSAQAQPSAIEQLEEKLQKGIEDKARRDAAAATSRAAPARSADGHSRFQVASEGVLSDAKLGLRWLRSDNGGPVDWAAAQSFCRGLGAGWGLPTVAQLQSLFDSNFSGIRCGPDNCKVSDRFRLSSFWFWSSQPNGSAEAWGVDLSDGKGMRAVVGVNDFPRALCVEDKARRDATPAKSGAGPALSAEGSSRFQVVSEGVLSGAKLGLHWTRSDNGGDVDWVQAQAYCRGMGAGWGLPTAAQLQSLFDSSLPRVRCGRGNCKVSDRFRLSNVWHWSSETDGSSKAWVVFLTVGERGSLSVGGSPDGRALCVRRP